MKKLIKNLVTLRNTYGIEGVKQSFEDEGASFIDILIMKNITALANVKLGIKISGAESINDINNCELIAPDSIVAPMIESEFALKKFVTSINNIDSDLYINIESKTAYDNLDSMLNSTFIKRLKGIVVGRSDLCASYDLAKDIIDSDEFNITVTEIMTKAKAKGLTTIMGGNITINSSKFIINLYNSDLLDKIETRNVIIDLSKIDINNLKKIIDESLTFEKEWLEYKTSLLVSKINAYNSRIENIKTRLNE